MTELPSASSLQCVIDRIEAGERAVLAGGDRGGGSAVVDVVVGGVRVATSLRAIAKMDDMGPATCWLSTPRAFGNGFALGRPN